MSKVHQLKTINPYFRDVYNGIKKFEVRYNDRDFQVGDTLVLKEYDAMTCKYSGNSIYRRVTYLLDDPELVKPGFVVLGIK